MAPEGLSYTRATYTTCPRHGGSSEVEVRGYASAAEARGSVPRSTCPWAHQRTEVTREEATYSPDPALALEGGDNDPSEAELFRFLEDHYVGRR